MGGLQFTAGAGRFSLPRQHALQLGQGADRRLFVVPAVVVDVRLDEPRARGLELLDGGDGLRAGQPGRVRLVLAVDEVLRLTAEQVVDPQPSRRGMRRVLRHRHVKRRDHRGVGGHQEVDRRALQLRL